MLTGSKSLLTYFPRYRWYPWRQKIIKERNDLTRKSKQLIPFQPYNKNQSGSTFSFTECNVPISLRKMQNYARLLRHKHLQDGIDWIEALCRPSARPLFHLLLRARKVLLENQEMDLARLYIRGAERLRGKWEKRVFLKRDGGYTVRRNNSHKFRITLTQMTMPEFFQKVYIEGKIPRCIVMDMQNAVKEGCVNDPSSFAPYLNSASRREHRKRLKWQVLNKNFNYFAERKKWIKEYENNRLNFENKQRSKRGLLPSNPQITSS
jgi:ribosomal protein L22